MGAENRDGAGRDFIDLIDETGALRFQVFDDMLVVHDLMADKNRRIVFFQRAFNNRDRADDAGAKSTRLRKHNLHAASAASEFLHQGHPVQ